MHLKRPRLKPFWNFFQVTIICLVGFSFPVSLFAQDDDPPIQSASSTMLYFDCSYFNCNYRLEGSFLGDVPTLRNDDDLSPYSNLGADIDLESYTAPEPGFPIAYASGQTLKVNVNFQTACQGLPSTVGLRGVSSTGYHFPALQLAVTTTSGGLASFTYESEASSEKNTFIAKPLPAGVVDLINLDITWQMNIGDWNNVDDWKEIAITNNWIYVTLNPAVIEDLDSYTAPTYNPFYYHTDSGFFIGCDAAKGSTSESEIIEKVWTAFEGGALKNSIGEDLKYYNGWDAENTVTAQGLTKERNGQCTGWARLFLTILKNMGAYTNMEILGIWTIDEMEQFLVKKWNDLDLLESNVANILSNHSTVANNLIQMGYTDVMLFEQDESDYTDYLHSENAYPVIYGDLSDESGIPGQNSPNPQSIFTFHQVSRVLGNGYVYDASYGGSPYVFINFEDFVSKFQNSVLYGVMRPETIADVSEHMLSIDLDGDNQFSTDLIDLKFYFVKKYEPSSGNTYLEVLDTQF